jgi:hypothetical protein
VSTPLVCTSTETLRICQIYEFGADWSLHRGLHLASTVQRRELSMSQGITMTAAEAHTPGLRYLWSRQRLVRQLSAG